MKKLIFKAASLCWKIAAWQPRPYIGWSGRDGNEPMSWWFYHYSMSDYDGLVEGNLLSRIWLCSWMRIGNFVRGTIK